MSRCQAGVSLFRYGCSEHLCFAGSSNFLVQLAGNGFTGFDPQNLQVNPFAHKAHPLFAIYYLPALIYNRFTCEPCAQPIAGSPVAFGFGAGTSEERGNGYSATFEFVVLPATATPNIVVFAIQEFTPPTSTIPTDESPYPMVRCQHLANFSTCTGGCTAQCADCCRGCVDPPLLQSQIAGPFIGMHAASAYLWACISMCYCD